MEALKNKFLVFVIIIASIFLFVNLGNMYLWYDEAETGIIGRNILKFGLPTICDGRHLAATVPDINQGYTIPDNSDINGCSPKDYVLVWLPWLQFYTASLSMLILGENTFGVRFLFALLGLFTVILFYFFSRKLLNEETAKIATVLLVTSIPFILQMRQAKYVALVAFSTIWLLYAYLKILNNEKYGVINFIASSAVLFHSNYSHFFGIFLGILTHYLLFNFKKRIKNFLIAILGIFLLTFPWFLYARISSRTDLFIDIYRALTYLKLDLAWLNNYIVPFIVPILFLIIFKKERKLFFKKLSLIVIVILSFILTLDFFVPEHYFRYITTIIPLAYLLLGYVIFKIMQKNKVIAYTLLIILIISNLFSAIPFSVVNVLPIKFESLTNSLNKIVSDDDFANKLADFTNRDVNKIKDINNTKNWLSNLDDKVKVNSKLRFLMFDFFYELTHDYNGPDKCIVNYLLKNGNEDQVVKTTGFSDIPIYFYTNMKAYNLDKYGLDLEHYPLNVSSDADWLIIRNVGWVKYNESSFDLSNYDKITLDCVDLTWDNRPDIDYHKFRTVKDGQMVNIYRLRT